MDNKHICFARKKNQPYCRCNNKNRIEDGMIFCKIHSKKDNVIRIDEPYLEANNDKNIENFIINSGDNIKLDIYKKKDLVKILNYYGLKSKGSKEKIILILKNHILSLKKYLINYDNILIIQRNYKKFKTRQLLKIQGPILIDKNISTNKEDFLTFDKINNIPNKLIFSYIDKDKHIYAFHIKSIYELLKETDLNPYTRNIIPDSVKQKVLKYYNLTKQTIINSEKKEYSKLKKEKLTLTQKTRQSVIEIFQLMDELDQYTNPNWFLDLNLEKLKIFYKELEDIWNYRLNLTHNMKREIIPPDGILFLFTPKYVSKIKDILLVKKICLEVMKKLITKSNNRSNRVNGCMYILLALVIVNKEAAISLPEYYNMIVEPVNTNSSYLIPV